MRPFTFFIPMHILVTKRTVKPPCGEKEEKVMKSQQLCRVLGTAILSFGIGVLVSFFLPEQVLVVIEAITIIGVGCIYFAKR